MMSSMLNSSSVCSFRCHRVHGCRPLPEEAAGGDAAGNSGMTTMQNQLADGTPTTQSACPGEYTASSLHYAGAVLHAVLLVLTALQPRRRRTTDATFTATDGNSAPHTPSRVEYTA